jgi:branched-subunit amino acid aminotransferase/4-amino-4-deoxychorismate lyase
MSSADLFRWNGSALVRLDHCDPHEPATGAGLEVADSWLVTEGTAFALGLHRERFERGIRQRGYDTAASGGPVVEVEPFWRAILAAIPATGDWFPRVELVSRDSGTGASDPAFALRFRLRSAPERKTTVTLATHRGDDPRTDPRVKGPDLAALVGIRTRAQQRGADEAILLSPDGYVVDGTTTAILWWRGDILCAPPEAGDSAGIGSAERHEAEPNEGEPNEGGRGGAGRDGFERVDSVTARSLFALAAALGTETYREAVTPAELDGTEVWAVNALHGIRIATGWVDGPSLAAEPGRLALWRARRDALRKRLEGPTT